MGSDLVCVHRRRLLSCPTEGLPQNLPPLAGVGMRVEGVERERKGSLPFRGYDHKPVGTTAGIIS